MMLWFDRHRRLRDQLSAYIDGALDSAATRRLQVHLEECEECRADLEQLRSTVAALRGLPEAQVPRSFTLSPERAAVRRPAVPAARLAFGARIAVAGVAVALAAVLVVDLGDLGGNGATEEVSAPQMTAEREANVGGVEGEGATAGEVMDEGSADEDEVGAAGGAAVPEPVGTPAVPEAAAEDTGDDFKRDTSVEETPAPEPEEVGAPAAAPSDDGIDALTAAEIGLGAALSVLVAGSLVLALVRRKR